MVSAARLWATLVLVALALVALPARAGETLYIEAGRVMTAAGEPIAGGRIVVRDGKITEVGKDVARPPFSRYVDARGMTVTPGFVVPGTRLALPPPPPPPPGEAFRVEMKPDAKAADEARWRDPALRILLEQGITSAGLLPLGQEAGIPGACSVVSTRGGTRAEALVLEDAALVAVVATPGPCRKAFADAFEKADAARHDRQARERRGAEVKGEPGPLEKVVARKKPVLLQAPSPARLAAAEDSLPLTLMDASVIDGTELWWEAARVKRLGLRVLTYPALTRQRATRYPINRAAEWTKAGVKVAFLLPDDSPLGAARLRDSVIELVRCGLAEDKALAALTSEAAAALGASEQVGSIQKGRRADLLFWSGSPFDPVARLERVMVGGAFVERVEPVGVAR